MSIYVRVERQEYQPTSNTIAYYKLKSDVNDYSGNGYNAESTTNITFGNIDGFECAIFNGGNAKLPNFTLSGNYTVLFWFSPIKNPYNNRNYIWNIDSVSGSTVYSRTMLSHNAQNRIGIDTSGYSGTLGTVLEIGKWYFVACIRTASITTYLYDSKGTRLTASSFGGTNFNGISTYNYLGDYQGSSKSYLGMSEFILENRVWSTSELDDYVKNHIVG